MNAISTLTAARKAASNPLELLAAKVNKLPVKTPRVTIAQRKAELKENFANYDVDRLLELQAQLNGVIDLVTQPLTSEGDILTTEDQNLVGRQYLAQQKMGELADVIKDNVKAIVFGHISAVLDAEGEIDPENTNGSIELPELGLRLCREGTGYATPTIDEPLLKELLGPERWAQVYEVHEKVVVEKGVNLEKLFALADGDPQVLMHVEAALAPATPKNGRLVGRKM